MILLIIIVFLWFLGLFVIGLEYVVDSKVEIVGKLEKVFFLFVVEEF